MSTRIGNPGLAAMTKGAALTAVAVLLLTVFAATVILGFAWVAGRSPVYVTVIGAFVVAGEIFYFRSTLGEIRDGVREGRNWLKGAAGEVRVASELDKLPADFIVFNDFHPVSADGNAAWNVDHVVVGPTGVFVIETKNYKSRSISRAARNPFYVRNVRQADRNALDLKNGLRKWSLGDLNGVFVVPAVVYAQDDVHIESLREGNVRVLPLRLLNQTIETHIEDAIDMDKAGRIARVLFNQMPVGDRMPFNDEMGEYTRRVREAHASLKRGALRDQRDAKALCPNCGSVLEEKTARKGPNTGNKFLACPRYPACRHTRSLSA